ncbi:MAG: xanthine dehydrogenase family protein molybdopterin-binding subunit [Acidobacteria bacterium]|nr:xanthine dehydrogenase family protein molybdopterin-binding subunit [Acidobacteriota bacterium]
MQDNVGQSIKRLESESKVSGELKYLSDLKLPGMLHCKALRSPYAHARIVRIDSQRAAKFSGVEGVLTRDDMVDNPHFDSHYGPVLKDQTVVALDKVRYVGDLVAAVAATRLDIAEEALDLIEVEYEELGAVFSFEEALAENAPLLHEQVSKPEHGFVDLADVNPVEGTNICTTFHLSKGDLEKGFQNSDFVFENVFTCPSAQHAALETLCAVARLERNGGLTIWSTVQNPFVIRDQIAELFHLPVSKVRVIALNIGGGYGSKLYPKLEPLVAALAWKTRKPVGLTLTREEVFQTITKHAAEIHLKTGVTREGRLLARQCRIYLDTGAYAEIGPRVAKKSGYTAAGPYNIPNIQIDSCLVYTNKVPAGAFRGFGVSQSAWAHESEMDLIARALQMDPLELRQKNLLEEGGEFATGEHVHSFGLRQCVERVASALQWGEKCPPPPQKHLARGKGMACLIKATITPSISSALVRLNEDGSATVYVGTADVGQGSDTIMAQIVSQELAIPVTHVQVVHSDTDLCLYDLTTSSSRSTFHMGRAVQLAAQDIRRQLACLAGRLWNCPVEEVLFANQGVRCVVNDVVHAASYRNLLSASFGIKGANLVGKGTVKTEAVQRNGEPLTSAFWFAGAGAAEVEVDRETGSVRVVRYASAADVGKAINPFFCEQQLKGGAITGIGLALMEQLVYQDGLLINPNFLDYNLARFLDIPEEIIPILVERAHEEGPYGAKGVGETALIPVAPAIANAIEDAVGVRVTDLPITPEKVLRALQEKEQKAQLLEGPTPGRS